MSFVGELSWNQICCKEIHNLRARPSTNIKSRTFLYTSNNHRENTIKTFTTATASISDFMHSFTGLRPGKWWL